MTTTTKLKRASATSGTRGNLDLAVGIAEGRQTRRKGGITVDKALKIARKAEREKAGALKRSQRARGDQFFRKREKYGKRTILVSWKRKKGNSQ